MKEELPPKFYLKQVAQHCPKSILTYMNLWEVKDEDNRVALLKKDVYSNYLISLTRFRNELMLLVREGLISIDESPNMITVEMVGWDEDGDEYLLC